MTARSLLIAVVCCITLAVRPGTSNTARTADRWNQDDRPSAGFGLPSSLGPAPPDAEEIGPTEEPPTFGAPTSNDTPEPPLDDVPAEPAATFTPPVLLLKTVEVRPSRPAPVDPAATFGRPTSGAEEATLPGPAAAIGVPYPSWEFRPPEAVEPTLGPRLLAHFGSLSPLMAIQPLATFGVPSPSAVEAAADVQIYVARFGEPEPDRQYEPIVVPPRPTLEVVFGDPAPAPEFRPPAPIVAAAPQRLRATLGGPIGLPTEVAIIEPPIDPSARPATLLGPTDEPSTGRLATLGGPEPTTAEILWLRPPVILQ